MPLPMMTSGSLIASLPPPEPAREGAGVLGPRLPSVGLADHVVGEHAIGFRPGRRDVAGPVQAERALDGPEQCLPDNRIMVRRNAVVHVTFGQFAGGRQDDLEVAQA